MYYITRNTPRSPIKRDELIIKILSLNSKINSYSHIVITQVLITAIKLLSFYVPEFSNVYSLTSTICTRH